jgi:class 3 adenylate cyclase
MDKPDPLSKTLAIVFCDIVAFSRVHATEGDLVAAEILRAFYEDTGQLAKERNCLTIKFIGDGFLATFENLGEAIPFVISVDRLLTQNQSLARHHLAFKFRLNYGDVLYMNTSYGTDVLGVPVNVAAHLNELAQPHQLIISQAAFSHLPHDLQARAGASETHSVRRVGAVEVRRMDLTAA